MRPAAKVLILRRVLLGLSILPRRNQSSFLGTSGYDREVTPPLLSFSYSMPTHPASQHDLHQAIHKWQYGACWMVLEYITSHRIVIWICQDRHSSCGAVSCLKECMFHLFWHYMHLMTCYSVDLFIMQTLIVPCRWETWWLYGSCRYHEGRWQAVLIVRWQRTCMCNSTVSRQLHLYTSVVGHMTTVVQDNWELILVCLSS